MREIKFRAWCKDEKRMIYLAESESSLTHLEMNNKSWGVFEPDREDYCGGCTCNNNYDDILMQYTGLHDKNGKKIYEGDILKRTLLPTRRIINISTVKWIPLKSCFSSVDIDGSSVTFISDYINSSYELEVIGNIYENPELLENE